MTDFPNAERARALRDAPAQTISVSALRSINRYVVGENDGSDMRKLSAYLNSLPDDVKALIDR